MNGLEQHVRRRERVCADAHGFAVNHARSVVRKVHGEPGQTVARQHVATARTAVAENAVEQQVIRDAIVGAQIGRLAPSPWGRGLG